MKGLAGFGLVMFLAVFVYVTMLSGPGGGGGAGVQIPLAFGEPQDGEVEMQVVVGVVMAARDQVRKKDQKIRTLPEWIRDHFVLTDSSGKVLEFRRLNNSLLIRPGEFPGTHEFFLTTRLKVGEPYEFDYVPEVEEGKRYRHTFTGPDAAAKVRQVLFEPV